MTLLIIANNIDGNIDGIGKHALMLSEEFRRIGHKVRTLSATSGFNKVYSFFTFKMSIVYCKAIFEVVRGNFDYIIVEYPFKEHNPLIMLFHLFMFIETRFCKTKIAFSMHEYDRVNVLRRRIIDVLLRLSDVIFVSENKYFQKFPSLAKKMHMRTIPNHIECNKKNKTFNPTAFCYFGLVNPSKAFNEMLKAWDAFNGDNTFTLHIISSTNLKDWELESHKGVRYYHNLENKDVVDIMFKCAFSIVPVIPEIGYNNSSFVSAVQCGCIPIGKFANVLRSKDFVLHVEDYECEHFVGILKQTQKIELSEFNVMSRSCLIFGEEFSLSKTANQMLTAFETHD